MITYQYIFKVGFSVEDEILVRVHASTQLEAVNKIKAKYNRAVITYIGELAGDIL